MALVQNPSSAPADQSHQRQDSFRTPPQTPSSQSANGSKPQPSAYEQGERLEPVDVRKQVIFQVRCQYPRLVRESEADESQCNARLFDARVPWEMVSVTEATVVVRCWRCRRYNPLRPSEKGE